MPRFAANLSFMFNEVPFLDRFEAAAKAGFKAVEFLFPYEHPSKEIAARLKGNGLKQALFNLPPGDWTKGERGLAALPGREEEFAAAVKTALDYATALECPRIHAMPGLRHHGADRKTYVANLKKAAKMAAPSGIDVIIEPINTRDTATAIREFGHLARHYQIANPPDRGEPDDGEMNYRYLFRMIDESGFKGYVGCEYKPRAGTVEGLKWAQACGVTLG